MMQVLDMQMEIWHGQIGKIESGGDDIVCQTLRMPTISFAVSRKVPYVMSASDQCSHNVKDVLFKRFIDSYSMR